ncbi:hypothetical protein [Spirulina major]|uniref:hypothetical protein n=1 Tax=Spirulina major TaxID=270636 RepID=UPI0009346F10|nr:hypothetical protein [Spirulina major]
MSDQNTLLTQKVAAGLLLWLFFGISLTTLGYPLLLNIVVGAIAGGAGIWIITWWHDTSPPTLSEDTSEESTWGFSSLSPLVPNRRNTHAPGIEEAQRLRIEAEARRRQNPNRRRQFFAIPRVFRRRGRSRRR